MNYWTPHQYQQDGMALMVGMRHAGLLLDPGMGKTATTLGAYEVIRQQFGYRMLVVAPIKPMYDTWPRECQQWEDFKHLRTLVLHGPKKIQRLAQSQRCDPETGYDHDIVLVNPEGLKWYLESTDEFSRPEVLCIDESTKFKNSQSKRFKELRKHLDGFTHRWILTGTVVPNGLMDLWSQMCIVDNGERLENYITHYKHKYFERSGWGGYDYALKDGAMEEITGRIGDSVLRLDAEDYLEMPELQNVTRLVELPPKAMKLYEKVESEFFNEMSNGTIVAKNAAAAGTKCRQIANGACYVEEGGWRNIHGAKIAALDELVEETNGNPLLVVYEYRHDKERLEDYFGPHAECITGVKGKKLESIVDRFNTGKLDVLLAHAGSLHGMNIQGYCRHIVWFGIPWNLESYIQAVWRLYRQGQKAPTVMCYHIVAKNTLDEQVVKVLADKEATQTMVEDLLKP